jgi:DNA-binding NarL/FixJ family response regulator
MGSVLIVEDEPLIRMMLADMLAELGHTIAGEASDLTSGLMLAVAPGLDAAILDVNLRADSSKAIAEALEGRAIPFAFASGYGADGLPQAFRNHRSLGKPFQIEELERCLVALLG